MSAANELFDIANKLASKSQRLEDKEFLQPLQKLAEAANGVGKAWCGSWLGYHSRVYYANFQEPPPGVHFSQEWGLMFSNRESSSDWVEYRFNDVIDIIQQEAENPDIKQQESEAKALREFFDESQSQVLSLVFPILEERGENKFLAQLRDKIQEIKLFSASNYIEGIRPTGKLMSRDIVAIEKGLMVPPHLNILAQVFAMKQPFEACAKLSKLAKRTASHISSLETHKTQSKHVGTNIFIGHGRSSVWKDLKDFIQDRLGLPWDEFNRLPIAGITNITRLSQMLNNAAVAFLIMTGEDEQVGGKQHARQNVIHEAGLFQGRLGFERAIVLLEDGCEEFSNIQGLGQIRFPKGNISAIFEEIRRVLEREGVIEE